MSNGSADVAWTLVAEAADVISLHSRHCADDECRKTFVQRPEINGTSKERHMYTIKFAGATRPIEMNVNLS